jgi:hypothetical protein
MLGWLQARAEIHAGLLQTRKTMQKAVETGRELSREVQELEKSRIAALKELEAIRDDSAQLSSRLVNPQTKALLAGLEQRAAALTARYRSQAQPALDRLPSPSIRTAHLISRLGESLDQDRQALARVKALVARAGAVVQRAESALNEAARQREAAAALGPDLDRCIDTLDRAVAGARKAVAAVEQALRACDYRRAGSLLDAVGAGPDKDRLARELADGLKLEGELEGLVSQARGLYRSCRPGQALELLNQALAEASCADHRRSIGKKIALAQKKQRHEKTTRQLFARAKKLYAEGEYAQARALLQKAWKHTTCQRYRDSLDEKIAIVDQRLAGGEGEEAAPDRCADYVSQLAAQGREVQRLVSHYRGIQRGTPNSPGEVLGPNACRAVRASELFGRIKAQALEAGCEEAGRVSDPAAGVAGGAIGAMCEKWKRRDQEPPDSPDCGSYRARKDRAAAEQKRLLDRYRRLQRARAPLSQRAPAACAALKKGQEISGIMLMATNRGCNVGSHSVWLPRGLKKDCRLIWSVRKP